MCLEQGDGLDELSKPLPILLPIVFFFILGSNFKQKQMTELSIPPPSYQIFFPMKRVNFEVFTEQHNTQ